MYFSAQDSIWALDDNTVGIKLLKVKKFHTLVVAQVVQ